MREVKQDGDRGTLLTGDAAAAQGGRWCCGENGVASCDFDARALAAVFKSSTVVTRDDEWHRGWRHLGTLATCAITGMLLFWKWVDCSHLCQPSQGCRPPGDPLDSNPILWSAWFWSCLVIPYILIMSTPWRTAGTCKMHPFPSAMHVPPYNARACLVQISSHVQRAQLCVRPRCLLQWGVCCHCSFSHFSLVYIAHAHALLRLAPPYTQISTGHCALFSLPLCEL